MSDKMVPVLVVEDSAARIDWFQLALPVGMRLVHAPSAGAALGILRRDKGHTYAAILLDHDLQEQALTPSDKHLSGTQVVGAVLENVSRDVPILVHSANPGRSVAMVARLEAGGFDVERITFAKLRPDWLAGWLGYCRELWADAHGIEDPEDDESHREITPQG